MAENLLKEILSEIRGLNKRLDRLEWLIIDTKLELVDPTPEEISAFTPYLDKMIDIIEPKIMVTLGRFSMAKFMPGVYISKVHGVSKVINWKSRKMLMVPMYRPAAGLRNGKVKDMLRKDFLSLKKMLKNYDKLTKVREESGEKKSKEKVGQMRLE